MDESDWKLWRSQGLGASDAPVIMGVSPWKTPLQLWEEKTGLAEPSPGNWATQRGNALEAKARAHYELRHNLPMPIAFVQHRDFPFIRASLDGFNEDANVVLEIKCPGKKDHELAMANTVPEKYWPQVQHQLLASGAKEVHYYSFDGEQGWLVSVKPDPTYIEILTIQLISFWDKVQRRIPPSPTERDYRPIVDPNVIELLEQWREAKKAMDAAEELASTLRSKILAHTDGHPRWRHDDIRIVKSKKSGILSICRSKNDN